MTRFCTWIVPPPFCIGSVSNSFGGSPGSATRRNSSLAVWPIIFLRTVVSWLPGASISTRFGPCCWMRVSLVPIALMRRFSTSIDCPTACRTLSAIAASVSARRTPSGVCVTSRVRPFPPASAPPIGALSDWRSSNALARSVGSAMRTTTARGSTPMPPDIPILPSRSFCRTSSRSASTWLLITEGVSTSINR